MDRFLVDKRRPAHVGANQFIYWEEGNPTRRLDPDVYVLPGVDRSIAIGSWKTWESGIVPSLAVEVASDDIAKDYEDGPPSTPASVSPSSWCSTGCRRRRSDRDLRAQGWQACTEPRWRGAR